MLLNNLKRYVRFVQKILPKYINFEYSSLIKGDFKYEKKYEKG